MIFVGNVCAKVGQGSFQSNFYQCARTYFEKFLLQVNIVQNVMQQKVSLKSGPQMGQYIGMFKTANTGPHLAYVYLHNALVNG